MITLQNFEFLKDLKKNNNREWFNENKSRYLRQHENVVKFADSLLLEMNKHDNIETPTGKKSLFRIYRDVRFSKDKSPYKAYWAGHFTRATTKLRGGYYFHIEPGNSMVGGGFWAPNKEDLQRIRQDIADDSSELRKIINAPSFKKHFGALTGSQLVSSPKGFNKDHPSIDLLRYKQFIVPETFTDKDVLSSTIITKIISSFKAMRPFLDYMSISVTTDANGTSIIQ